MFQYSCIFYLIDSKDWFKVEIILTIFFECLIVYINFIRDGIKILVWVSKELPQHSEKRLKFNCLSIQN